jgi:hypothetical protein
MRGWIKSCVLASVGLIVANAALAAGPQFTGLLNVYNSSSNGFQKTSNSLAQMTPAGPVEGTVVPLSGGWSDVVVNPSGSAYYTITSNVAWKFNADTGVGAQLPNPWGALPDTGWLVGQTWDTTRNRLVVASLSGQGYFFGYLDSTNQWSTISSLQQTDLRSIAYRASNDTIYAIPNDPRPNTTQLFKYNANGAQIGTLNLSQALSTENSGDDLDWQMTFASDGQIAVLKPAMVPGGVGGGSVAGTWLYLINPDTGAVSYSAPLPVPEPGTISIVCVAVGFVLRRRR